MAGILFFFEDNDIDIFSGRRLDLSAWNYAIKSAGDITKVIIVNRTSLQISTFDSDLEYFLVTKDLPQLDGSIIHVVCPWDNTCNTVSLWNYEHSADWYLFGPAKGWKEYGKLSNGLTIPVANNIAFHSVHAASIVMAHRYGVNKWQHR
jgi:hypothetical protein